MRSAAAAIAARLVMAKDARMRPPQGQAWPEVGLTRLAASAFSCFGPRWRLMAQVVRVHGTCVARSGAGVLLLGPAGAGKSDLALRLLSRGFDLVADDQVVIEDGVACPPPPLAGLMEVRGVGIVRLAYVAAARLALGV